MAFHLEIQHHSNYDSLSGIGLLTPLLFIYHVYPQVLVQFLRRL